MIVTTYVRSETQSLDDIKVYLEGRVFHVTKLEHLPSILKCGEIRANSDGKLPTTFGFSKNAYFRKRNCVSLFDYRAKPTDTIKRFREHCPPFSPASPNNPIAILILDPAAYNKLIPWTAKRNEDNAHGEMIVPNVETGYPGPLSLRLITEIIKVEINDNPNSLAALVRKAHKD